MAGPLTSSEAFAIATFPHGGVFCGGNAWSAVLAGTLGQTTVIFHVLNLGFVINYKVSACLANEFQTLMGNGE